MGIKILVFLPFNSQGSLQMRAFHVARYLKLKKIETCFVVPKGSMKLLNLLTENEFNVYTTDIQRPSIPNSIDNLIRFLKYCIRFPLSLLEAYRIIKKEMPDIIQVVGFISIQEAIIASLCFRKRFIWNLIGDMYPKPLIRFFQPLINLASKRILIAKKMAEYYGAQSGDFLIREYVDANHFNPDRVKKRDISTLRAALDVSYPVIGFVGSITPVKGLEHLIGCFQEIVKQYPKAKLLILGSSPRNQSIYYNQLLRVIKKSKLREKVIFVGYIDQKDLPIYYSIFDVFVLPSLHEGTPVAILEAMAMKKIVIASKVGGIEEIVSENKTGFLIEVGDCDNLSKIIIEVLKSPELLDEIRNNARKHVVTHYSFDRCTNSYYKLYLTMTGGKI